MIKTGTSGFSYTDSQCDWRNVFYPADIKQNHLLEYYSGKLDFVEINVTFYRHIQARTALNWVKQTRGRLEFAVKAHKNLTHQQKGNESDFIAFREGIKPLVDLGAFGCVIAQFPFSYHNNPENRKYLSIFAEKIQGLPVVVEFRNADWLDEATYKLLRKNKLGFCNVDEPEIKNLLPRTSIITSDIGYLRFHGRNNKNWWGKNDNPHSRYDYLYSEAELKEWLPKIREMAGRTKKMFIAFNNCYGGKSAINAIMTKRLLKGLSF